MAAPSEDRTLAARDPSLPLPAPRAVAFDLDGTLIDSRGDIAAACNRVLVAAGRPALDDAVIATFVGDGARALVARAFGLDLGASEVDPLHDEFVRFYAEHPVVHTTWMPGALSALDALGERPLAVVTNKTRSVSLQILEALGAAKRFAAVYGGGDGPLKPSPEPVRRLAQSLAVTVGELWLVGDGDQDVQAGRRAGCVTIGVLGGFHSEARLRQASPDRLIRSLAELPGLVAQASRERLPHRS